MRWLRLGVSALLPLPSSLGLRGPTCMRICGAVRPLGLCSQRSLRFSLGIKKGEETLIPIFVKECTKSLKSRMNSYLTQFMRMESFKEKTDSLSGDEIGVEIFSDMQFL